MPDIDLREPTSWATWQSAADKLKRLVALKRQYDPQNVLRQNHNIPPD